MIAPPLRPEVPPLHQLTGIRGLAAWYVVLYHIRLSTTAFLPETVIAALGKGYLAVDAFFMLSGFVMWMNYGLKLNTEGWAGIRRFFWKRFARIWPLHLLILGAMVLFSLALLATGRPIAEYPLTELPLHILLIQNWGFTSSLAWNDPAWSISTEFAAYLLFPAIAFAMHRQADRPAVLVLAGLALLVALHGFFAAFGYRELGAAITRTGLVRCLAEFTIGVVMALCWDRLGRARARLAVVFGAISVTVAVAGAAAKLPETTFVPAAFASGLLALALGRGSIARLLASRPLRWLGDISYATYLSHFFLFVLFKIAFVDRPAIGIGELLGFVLLLLGVSAILYHGFEKPVQRWLNQRLRPHPLGSLPPGAVPAADRDRFRDWPDAETRMP